MSLQILAASCLTFSNQTLLTDSLLFRDTTAFSAVATNDVGDVIYGFFAASHEPFALENDPSKSTNTSTYLPESYSKMPSWLSWVQQQFECPESMKVSWDASTL